jgi:hypothetical protein
MCNESVELNNFSCKYAYVFSTKLVNFIYNSVPLFLPYLRVFLPPSLYVSRELIYEYLQAIRNSRFLNRACRLHKPSEVKLCVFFYHLKPGEHSFKLFFVTYSHV